MADLTVAVLGTGIMGAGMARNLRGAGIAVRAWNRTRAKAEPLAADGITVCGTAAEAVDGADAVLTMAFDAASTRSALADAPAPAGTLWLQMATVGIDGATELGELAAERGWVYVDAPVLGTRAPAEQGTLTVLASGPDDVRERCAPYLDAVGARTLWLGPAGQGSRLKLVANSWVGTICAGTGQAIALAEGLGVAPQAFLEAIEGTPSDSAYARMKAPAMIGGDFATSFSVGGVVKDLGLIIDAARSAGVDDGLAERLRALYARSAAAGHAEDDMAAVVAAFRPPR